MATNKTKFDVSQSSLFSQIETPEDRQVVRTPEGAKMGRPRNERIVRDNPAQEGLTADYIRATFIVEVELLETLKDYAYTERLSIKDVINEALRSFVDSKVDKQSLLHKPNNKR